MFYESFPLNKCLESETTHETYESGELCPENIAYFGLEIVNLVDSPIHLEIPDPIESLQHGLIIRRTTRKELSR
jgi:hypothetical protein